MKDTTWLSYKWPAKYMQSGEGDLAATWSQPELQEQVTTGQNHKHWSYTLPRINYTVQGHWPDCTVTWNWTYTQEGLCLTYVQTETFTSIKCKTCEPSSSSSSSQCSISIPSLFKMDHSCCNSSQAWPLPFKSSIHTKLCLCFTQSWQINFCSAPLSLFKVSVW